MDERIDNSDSSVDNSLLPPFGKGAIVLTPQQFIGRVRWIHEDDQVGVEYLEMPSAYNVYQSKELTLLLPSAENPKFDEVCQMKVLEERRRYEEEKAMVAEFKTKNKKVSKTPMDVKIEEALSKLSGEDVIKLLEELK